MNVAKLVAFHQVLLCATGRAAFAAQIAEALQARDDSRRVAGKGRDGESFLGHL